MIQHGTFLYGDRGLMEGLVEAFLELGIEHCAGALVIHQCLVGCAYALFQVFHLELDF
jgi:hypothetical protein